MQSFFGLGGLAFASTPTVGLPMEATRLSITSAIAARSALFFEGVTVAEVLFPVLEIFAPWVRDLTGSGKLPNQACMIIQPKHW